MRTPVRASAVLSVVFLLGCRHASRVEATPEPMASAVPAPVSLCASGAAGAKRAYHAAARRWLGDAQPSSKTLVGWCSESSAGAWWFDLPDLADVHDAHAFEYATEARLVIVFQPRDGAAVRLRPKDPFSDYGVRTFAEPWTFDYDADGVPELWVQVREEGDEGHRARLVELLSFRGGVIVPYPPASAIAAEGASDVDGDGRPDLLVYAGYAEALEGCGSGFPYDQPEPRFVAHARADGAFSLDDAAAKAFARKTCPAAPLVIGSSYDAICARLWAKDVAKGRAHVAASCKPWSCAAESAGTPQAKGATEDCERRLRFFDRTPPFTLLEP